MFRNPFKTPSLTPKDIADEIASLCHADQIDRLTAPKSLLKDIGLDCGCGGPTRIAPRTLL